MANPNNPAQAQMMRDDMQNQPSDQNPNFLQETGTHVTNMAQGATDVGKGAVMGATSLARGAVQGTANVAQGVADAIKNTFGGGSTTATANQPAGNTDMGGSAPRNIDMDASTYPNKPSHPHTPNTSI